MILWIIFFVCLALAIFCGFKSDRCKTNRWDKICAAIACICSASCFAIFVTNLAIVNATAPDEKYDVCSLTANTHTDKESAGLFILGVGAYNSKTTKDTNYYFYKKEKQGGWKLTKVDAYDVVIFEDEDKKPYFVEVNKSNKDYNELHLPKNTIKKDISKINIAELIK